MENIISVAAASTPATSGKPGLPPEGMPEFPFFQILDQQIGSLQNNGQPLPAGLEPVTAPPSQALPELIIEAPHLRIDGMDLPPGGDLLPPLPKLTESSPAESSLAGTSTATGATWPVPTPEMPQGPLFTTAELPGTAPAHSIVLPSGAESGKNTNADPVLMSLGEFRQQRGAAASPLPAVAMQSTQPTEMTEDLLPAMPVPQRLSAAIAAQLGREPAGEPMSERLANLSGATQTLAQTSVASSLSPGLSSSLPSTAPAPGHGESFASELQRFTPAEQPLSTPVKDPRWGEAVGQRLTWMASNGGGRAEIQLDPPELGRLNVEIQIRGESAQVHFQSDQGVVRDALDSALPRLREMLAQAGFGDLQLDVSQHNRNGQGQGNAAGSEFAAGEGSGQEVGGISGGEAVSVDLGSGNGLVDYYA